MTFYCDVSGVSRLLYTSSHPRGIDWFHNLLNMNGLLCEPTLLAPNDHPLALAFMIEKSYIATEATESQQRTLNRSYGRGLEILSSVKRQA